MDSSSISTVPRQQPSPPPPVPLVEQAHQDSCPYPYCSRTLPLTFIPPETIWNPSSISLCGFALSTAGPRSQPGYLVPKMEIKIFSASPTGPRPSRLPARLAESRRAADLGFCWISLRREWRALQMWRKSLGRRSFRWMRPRMSVC